VDPLDGASFLLPTHFRGFTLFPICAGTVQLRHIAIKYEEKKQMFLAKRIIYADFVMAFSI